MDIVQQEFTSKNGGHHIYGMNISQFEGRTMVNLFTIEEDRELRKDEERDYAGIGGHIWEVTQDIIDNVFHGKGTRQDYAWTLTKGYFTTAIHLEELNAQPYHIALSDTNALRIGCEFPLERYSKEYLFRNGTPIHESDLEPAVGPVYPKDPKSAFAIPWADGKDGVFYCKPPAYNTDEQDRYEYVLLEPTKAISALRQLCPEAYEGRISTIKPEFLVDAVASPDSGYTTAELGVGLNGANKGLRFEALYDLQDTLAQAEQIGLPFIPIQIRKDAIPLIAKPLRELQGIKPASDSSQPKP